jgi:hypothetical protein
LIGLFIRSVIVRRTPLEVDAGLAGRDAEHGDAAAVRHVRDARVQRLGATRHLERDVEPFGHAKLTSDIAEVAFAWNLSEGILRMRYRESFRTPTLIVPDQVYRIEIDLLRDQQSVPARSPASCRYRQQQLSGVRRQLQHRRTVAGRS